MKTVKSQGDLKIGEFDKSKMEKSSILKGPKDSVPKGKLKTGKKKKKAAPDFLK